MTESSPQVDHDVSVIVPALNEGENLPLLVPRIDAALGPLGLRYEVIVVDDDSRDNTAAACAALAARFPVRCIVRDRPKNGLSGAVLEGMAASRGRTLVVMDADLQHPPERIPALIEQLDGGAEFVIGSRYVSGASTAERWGAFRRLNSTIATLLARPFAGRTSDPMSGYFALPRGVYERAERLTPLGYKIGLELMCKGRVRDVREVPIDFAARQHGQSKLTLKQQFRYLEHLSRLYDYTYPRLSPILKFMIATLCGWFVALAAFLLLADRGAGAAAATVVTYPLVVLVVAVFHLRYVRTQREFLATRRPWGDFAVIAVAEWAVCALAALWIDARVRDPSPAEFFVLCFGLATAVRYALRKEFLQDVRGLRREVRREDLK